MKKLYLPMGDNETLKWTHNGEEYLIHVQQDEMAESPRDIDDGNVAILACFHRRYELGDKLDDLDPQAFWQRLVRENVSDKELSAAIRDCKLPGLRLEDDEDCPGLVNIFAITQYNTVLGNSDPSEDLIWEGIPVAGLMGYLCDDLTISHCMTLMQPYAEWMPLWLYDHSGLAISCGARNGQFADRWDSGQLGWVISMKSTVMNNLLEFVLDENGEQVMEETKGPDGHVWKHPVTKPLTEETWRTCAIKNMEAEVNVYNMYIQNQVYSFTLYKREDGEWVEQNSEWGFYGCDIIASGMVDEIGLGLEEAITSDQYESGTATVRTITQYSFDD